MFIHISLRRFWDCWNITKMTNVGYNSRNLMTSSNGNIYALLALWQGNPPVTGGFHSQRPVTRSSDVFFFLRLNERLSKESGRRWFQTPLHSTWRHCNDMPRIHIYVTPTRVMCLNELTSPGHQQPWYWLHRVNGSQSFTGNDFNGCAILVLRSYSDWL